MTCRLRPARFCLCASVMQQGNQARSYNCHVRRLTTLVAVLLLLSEAVPMLACVTDIAMSHNDSACCRSMHNQCGDMAKTGCCRIEIKSDQQPKLTSMGPSFNPQWTISEWVPIAEAFGTPTRIIVSKMPDEHSPPGLIVVRIANLRI